MKKNSVSVIFTSFLLFSCFSKADYGEDVSIYNIADGTLVYSYRKTANSDVSADYAYELKGSEKANWNLFYTDDGYIIFENIYSNNCLAYYGKGYQAIEKNCDTSDVNQKIKPKLMSTGAIQLRFPLIQEGSDTCLYNYAGSSNFYVYTDICLTNENYLWSLVPVLSNSSD